MSERKNGVYMSLNTSHTLLALNLRMRVLERTASTGVQRTIFSKEKGKAREEKLKLNELWEDTEI